MRLTALEPPVTKFCAKKFAPVNYSDILYHTSLCLGLKPPTALPKYSYWPDFPTLHSFLAFFVLYVCVAALEIFCCVSGLGLIRGEQAGCGRNLNNLSKQSI